MKSRLLIIVLLCQFILACIPSSMMTLNRDVQYIEVGLGVDGAQKILTSNEAVDTLAVDIISLMKNQGYVLNYQSTSWGLLPFTGHTQNMSFSKPENRSIYCYVKISKKEFGAYFREIESEPRSGKFLTSLDDKVSIDKTLTAINELTRKTFKKRASRVSKFYHQNP